MKPKLSTTKKDRLVEQIQRYIEMQGELQNKDVCTEGIFLKDSVNKHHTFYRWSDLLELQINALWTTIRTHQNALALKFVIYPENDTFRAACGLAVVNEEWFNYFGFVETKGVFSRIPIHPDEPTLDARRTVESF